jgi:hypothetical protein
MIYSIIASIFSIDSLLFLKLVMVAIFKEKLFELFGWDEEV